VMRSDNNLQQELQELNNSLPVPQVQHLYAVPEGYFEGLAASVLAKVKAQEAGAAEEIQTLSPFLASLSRTMPFEVPGDYFDTALEGIASEESIPAEWEGARFNPTYSVPAGYFENLPAQILAKVQPEKTAKLISIGQRLMRYASAACLTGLIAMSTYLYFGKPGVIDAQEQPHQWVAAKLQNVSNQELDSFIQTATNETVNTAKPSKTEVKKLLTDVSDKELDEFLNQVPVSDEMN